MYKFGIIGGGMVAKYHAQAIKAMSSRAELVAIYSRNEAKGQKLADEFTCKPFSNLDEFLSVADIDIVTIATPSGHHLDAAVAAARAKKHIICEKPLEINPSRCQQMIDVAQMEGVLLSGIFNRRFNPAVHYLKKAVDNGRFGQLTLCDAHFKWYRTQAYYDSAKWRGTMSLDGGGAMMNQGSHTIDLFLYLIGAKVKRLAASTSMLIHENIEVEDTAAAILEFENGVIGTIQGATSCWSSGGNPAEIQLCGSHGTVILSDDKFRVWDFKNDHQDDSYIKENLMAKNEKGVGANDPNAINYESHQRNFENVLDALDKNQIPLISGQEAKKAVEVICAIYDSANDNGSWVKLL